MSEKMNSEFRDLWVAYCEQKEEVAALTEQVATLTARLTELEGADIALEDAIAEIRRMREERDKELADILNRHRGERDIHVLFATIDTLTEQLAEMTRERAEAWSNAADANNDLAYVTASKNVAERERDEALRKLRFEHDMREQSQEDATSLVESYALASARALAAEQRVKELEGVVDAVRQWGEYTPRRVARALAALTGTEPGKGT